MRYWQSLSVRSPERGDGNGREMRNRSADHVKYGW
jgi:hypothetical protein